MIEAKRAKRTRSNTIVAISTSYERDPLLARGMGFEHLKELVERLARPIVVAGLSVAYAGSWKDSPDNFTKVLLGVISAEQDDVDDLASAALPIAPLVNHLAWPHYLAITPRIEAEAINSCRIIRVTQDLAGLTDVCPDAEAAFESDRAVFNAAVTLSAMRKLQVTGMPLDAAPYLKSEHIPPLEARILIGGKATGFRGFAPGVFEEALLMLEARKPVYLLGGFGGATGELADLLLEPATAAQITTKRLEDDSPALRRLNKIATSRTIPSTIHRGTEDLVARLHKALVPGGDRSSSIAQVLNTGLNDSETQDLITTNDMDTAVRLIVKGLRARGVIKD